MIRWKRIIDADTLIPSDMQILPFPTNQMNIMSHFQFTFVNHRVIIIVNSLDITVIVHQRRNEILYKMYLMNFKMKAKASKATQEPKAKLVSHGNQRVGNIGTHHQTARQRSKEIFNATWTEKEALRANRQQQHAPYTQIERAFVAISMTTEGEIEQDEAKAKTVATELKTELEHIDASEANA
jgi:hypothetical protein